MALKFSGASGRKPQTPARRYVYRVLARMLDPQLWDDSSMGRWMLDGLDEEPDRRRVIKAMRAVRAELERKGNAP